MLDTSCSSFRLSLSDPVFLPLGMKMLGTVKRDGCIHVTRWRNRSCRVEYLVNGRILSLICWCGDFVHKTMPETYIPQIARVHLLWNYIGSFKRNVYRPTTRNVLKKYTLDLRPAPGRSGAAGPHGFFVAKQFPKVIKIRMGVLRSSVRHVFEVLLLNVRC